MQFDFWVKVATEFIATALLIILLIFKQEII